MLSQRALIKKNYIFKVELKKHILNILEANCPQNLKNKPWLQLNWLSHLQIFDRYYDLILEEKMQYLPIMENSLILRFGQEYPLLRHGCIFREDSVDFTLPETFGLESIYTSSRMELSDILGLNFLYGACDTIFIAVPYTSDKKYYQSILKDFKTNNPNHKTGYCFLAHEELGIFHLENDVIGKYLKSQSQKLKNHTQPLYYTLLAREFNAFDCIDTNWVNHASNLLNASENNIIINNRGDCIKNLVDREVLLFSDIYYRYGFDLHKFSWEKVMTDEEFYKKVYRLK